MNEFYQMEDVLVVIDPVQEIAALEDGRRVVDKVVPEMFVKEHLDFTGND